VEVSVKMLLFPAPQKFNTFNTFTTFHNYHLAIKAGFTPSVTPSVMTKEGVILSPQAKNLGTSERTHS
jgi:hypothetical protein